MTTLSDLTKAAFREGNLTPIKQPPTGDELAEGNYVLNRLYLSAFSGLVGDNIADWLIPRDQQVGAVHRTYPLLPGAGLPLVPRFTDYPPQNSRIVWGGTEVLAYLPNQGLSDGAGLGLVKGGNPLAVPGTLTLNGNGHTIDGANTFTCDASSYAPHQWFYRADLGDWVTVKLLDPTDDMPFPPEFDDVWTIGTAIRLAPRYGKTIDPVTIGVYKQRISALAARYQQSAPGVGGGDEMAPAAESFGYLASFWPNV